MHGTQPCPIGGNVDWRVNRITQCCFWWSFHRFCWIQIHGFMDQASYTHFTDLSSSLVLGGWESYPDPVSISSVIKVTVVSLASPWHFTMLIRNWFWSGPRVLRKPHGRCVLSWQGHPRFRQNFTVYSESPRLHLRLPDWHICLHNSNISKPANQKKTTGGSWQDAYHFIRCFGNAWNPMFPIKTAMNSGHALFWPPPLMSLILQLVHSINLDI